tara:strand:- start:443 stop:616 length:174 start_codon:yes stop_codon:yes gene_type:complete
MVPISNDLALASGYEDQRPLRSLNVTFSKLLIKGKPRINTSTVIIKNINWGVPEIEL